jgi:hypothetical protein
MTKKQKGINPALESAISQMLAAVMRDPAASITDKTKVLDRALKLEAIKLKMIDDEWGSGFKLDEEEES